MYDNYNYPLGADTPDAPWNEKKPTKEVIEVTVSHTLSKNTIIKVYEEDDPVETYKEQHYNILELLSLFKSVLEHPDLLNVINKKLLIKECSEWVEDDFEVCEN